MENESIVYTGLKTAVGKKELERFFKGLAGLGYEIVEYISAISSYVDVGYIEIELLLEKDSERYLCKARWEVVEAVWLVRSIMRLVNMEIIKCDCTN